MTGWINRDAEHARLLAACKTYVALAEIKALPQGEKEYGVLDQIRAPLLKLHPIPDPTPPIYNEAMDALRRTAPVTRKKVK